MQMQVTISGNAATLFDSAKLMKLVKKGIERSLKKCGAFVRTEAKSSLRYGKKSASPGAAPIVKRAGMSRTTKKKDGSIKTRVVSPLKELIYFAFDPATESVVVGPADFRNRASKTYRVPSILESGGSVTARTPKGQAVRRQYAGNPFMAPALRRVQSNFPSMFQNLLG